MAEPDGQFDRVITYLTHRFKKESYKKFLDFVEIIKVNQIPNGSIFSDAEIKQYIWKSIDDKKTTVLHLAATMENSKVLEFLLKNTSNVELNNSNEVTPLMLAIGSEDIEKVMMLTAHGGSPNNVDSEGNSPISSVILSENIELLKYLLQNGLNPNLCYNEDSHSTLLHLAARIGSIRQVRLLIEYNASYQKQNTDGQAAIHLATMGDYAEIVEFLILSGDDMNRIDFEQLTPLNYAKLYGAIQVENLLHKKNASMRHDLWLEHDPSFKEFDGVE
ncbi:hypothetical protein GJ496_007553 [Pomphorhynchus laevis]|nr:hypothetical protein GJ496_007553 [Pomphorhynchus laevis]